MHTSFVSVCVVKILKICSACIFQIYDTLLLILVAALYSSCPEISHPSCLTETLYLLNNISLSIPSAPGNHIVLSAFMNSTC